MLDLILGPFRSGKTGYILDILKKEINAKSNPLVLVPTRILRDEFSSRIAGAAGGYAGRIVYTLGEFVQSVTSSNNNLKQISEFESYVLIRMIIERNKNKFIYFRDIDIYSGVIRLIYSIIMELRAGSTLAGCEDIRQFVPGRGDTSENKWQDILLVYDEYENLLIKSSLFDSYRLFKLASSDIKETGSLPWSMLAVDGFFDFTAAQFSFIKCLVSAFEKDKKQACMTMLSSDSPVVKKTLADLNTGFKLNIIRPGDSGALDGTAMQEGIKSCKISVIKAFGKYREIEKIANEIKRLKVIEQVPYSEIEVIISNMSKYGSIVKSVFARYGIPYYNTEDEPLRDNPAIIFLFYICESAFKDRMIDSIGILSIVSSNYTSNREFKTLKSLTGVFPSFIRADRTGWLNALDSRERYYGDKRFNGDTYGPFAEEELERKIDEISRLRPVLDSLLKLILPHEAVMTIDGFILWLSELTSALGMQETIGGDPLAARDFTAFRKLKEALASIRKSLKLLGNSSFSGIELFSLIDNLIQNTSYRYQYYPDDAVKVGKPFDMRESSMRAVFIAGLNEGEFPPAASLSLIDGREKRRINSLASKVIFQEEELRSMTDRLDFEVAVSRCREFLYLSRTPFDESGREILPSIFLQSVAPEETLSGGDEIFEIVPSSSWMEIFDLGILVSHDLNLMDESVQREILRENPLIATNARLMRNYFDIIGAVNRAYRSGKSPADKTGLEYFGICGDKSAWIKEKAEKMVFSGSRLETFGNCRFNFLLRYIIGIHGEEYPSQKIKSTLKGSFYHAVLKDYISEAGEKVPDYEILDSCIERNFREFVNMEGEKGLFTMEKGVYRAFLREFIEFDAQCLRDYSPAFTEEPLDDVLDTGEGLFMPLTGSIDRIDSAGADGPLRIIDYKTGNTGHFKKDYLIPLKLFQGFIYAWSVKKHVSEISFVSIEKKGRERKTDILPFIRGKHAVLNFHEIWNEKVYEIKTIFALIGKGDFSPVTLESDYEETVLEFYRAFHDDPEESIEVESPGKCTFCVYKLACPREDKLISRP